MLEELIARIIYDAVYAMIIFHTAVNCRYCLLGFWWLLPVASGYTVTIRITVEDCIYSIQSISTFCASHNSARAPLVPPPPPVGAWCNI